MKLKLFMASELLESYFDNLIPVISTHGTTHEIIPRYHLNVLTH